MTPLTTTTCWLGVSPPPPPRDSTMATMTPTASTAARTIPTVLRIPGFEPPLMERSIYGTGSGKKGHSCAVRRPMVTQRSCSVHLDWCPCRSDALRGRGMAEREHVGERGGRELGEVGDREVALHVGEPPRVAG